MSFWDLSTWLPFVPAAGLLIVLAGIAWRLIRAAYRLFRKVGYFLDDFNGEDARPGQPARPGMSERVAAIEHQFLPNNGATMRDAIDRVERKAEAAAKLASDSSEQTRKVVEQHIWHVEKFHGQDRRHTPPTAPDEGA